ncbi:MAG: hypothetical protein MUO76_18040 [Anaerolineaceae bacterium]|nr:hypothetical protein [Anaerolineaceae bacterium]
MMTDLFSNQDIELELLQKVERGELSAEEALESLESLRGAISEKITAPDRDEHFAVSTIDEVDSDRFGHETRASYTDDAPLRQFTGPTRWWIVSYSIGVIFTTMGSIWLYLGWNARQFGFGFFVAWIPFVLGIVLMSLSWRARASHWLHLRIRRRPGQRPSAISFSIPLPFGVIKWVSRNFGQYFPSDVQGIDFEELIDELAMSVSSENPIYIWVNDDKEEQQVEIWIGGGETSA